MYKALLIRKRSNKWVPDFIRTSCFSEWMRNKDVHSDRIVFGKMRSCKQNIEHTERHWMNENRTRDGTQYRERESKPVCLTIHNKSHDHTEDIQSFFLDISLRDNRLWNPISMHYRADTSTFSPSSISCSSLCPPLIWARIGPSHRKSIGSRHWSIYNARRGWESGSWNRTASNPLIPRANARALCGVKRSASSANTGGAVTHK